MASEAAAQAVAMAQSATGAPPATLAQVQTPPPPGRGVEALTLSDWLAISIRVAAPLVVVILLLADIVRPGSFQRKGLRDVKAYAWPVWLFGAFVVISAQIFGAQVFAQIPDLWEKAASNQVPVQSLPRSEIREEALTQLGAVLFGVFAGGVMVFLLNRREHDEGMRFGPQDIPIGIVAFLLAFPLVSAAAELSVQVYESSSGEVVEQVAHPTLRLIQDHAGDPWAWVLIGCAVIGVAIIEELIYRAFIQTGLLRLFGSAWTAIILTAVIFGLVHRIGDTVPWHQIPTLMVLGLAIGIAYERFKGVGVPITMHAAFNALQIALTLWVISPEPAPQPASEAQAGGPPPATQPQPPAPAPARGP